MTTTLTNNISLKTYTLLEEVVGLATASSKIEDLISDTLATSDGLYTITANMVGTSDSYDLAGALADPLGHTVVFATVEFLLIKNLSEMPITIGGANGIALLGSSDILTIPAYGSLLLLGSIPVVASTGDLLIVNSLVADWTAGTYTLGTYKRHTSNIYKVKVTSTDKEPTVTSGWETDWELVDSGEEYQIVVIGTK